MRRPGREGAARARQHHLWLSFERGWDRAAPGQRRREKDFPRLGTDFSPGQWENVSKQTRGLGLAWRGATWSLFDLVFGAIIAKIRETTDDSRFFRTSMEGRGSRSASRIYRDSRSKCDGPVTDRSAARRARGSTRHKPQAPPEARRDPPPAQRTGAQWAVDVGCAAVPRGAAAHLERSLPCVVSTRLTSVAMAHLAALSVPTTWPADVADHRRRAQDKDLQSTL
jgi:hypothetical protein